MAIKQALYRGFSSFEFQRKKTFRLNDIESVKMDLLNHVFTKKGERVMMPGFGTVIPEILFEPLTPDAIETVREEVLRVINYDPRVDLLNIEVRPDYDTNSLTVATQLFYIELNLVDNLELNIGFEG